MILSYDNEANQEKDDLNESIEMAKIKTIEGLLTQKNETEQEEDKEKSSNESGQYSSCKKKFGDLSQGFSSRDAPLSREEQCFQTDVWQEIEKSVKQSQMKPNLEEKIINVSSESSSSHHSKNYILKSELTGLSSQVESLENREAQMNSRFVYFLSNKTQNPNTVQSNQILNTFDTQPYSKLMPFPIKIEDDSSPLFSSNIQMTQPFSPTASTQPKTNVNNSHFNKQKINYDQLSLEEIINKCSVLCLEQIGCRFLQKLIDEYPMIAKEMYFTIKNSIVDISCNSFGNYFVQKIIEHLSLNELDDLIRGDIATHFNLTCLSSHGTRVIQKYFEKIYMHDYLVNIFNILLKPNIVEFTKNPNANHIIIKYVSLIQSPRNDFIIHTLNGNLIEIATNKHSCCALQKCLEYSNLQQKQMLLMTIAKKSPVLFVNQFGNYVIQFALMFEEKEVNKIIINNYLNEFPKYASHKFASNIFEKCLDFSEKETKKLIIERLCNPIIVQNLLFDTYGNYVLQKAMQHSKEPYRSKYINMILPLMEKLQIYPFGHKIYQKLIINFPELSQYKSFQPNLCYPMNNYGNICYQNNYFYTPKYFQNGNINMPGFDKPHPNFTPPLPSFQKYMGQHMYN